MVWLCDIQLPAAGPGVRRARALADVHALNVPAPVRDDLRLLISELVTNAVRHGTRAGDPSAPPIRVRVGRSERRLRVEVTDHGPGFRFREREADADKGSGWGVQFVDMLADHWGTTRGDDDAWTVWFEIDAPAGGHGSSTARARDLARVC